MKVAVYEFASIGLWNEWWIPIYETADTDTMVNRSLKTCDHNMATKPPVDTLRDGEPFSQNLRPLTCIRVLSYGAATFIGTKDSPNVGNSPHTRRRTSMIITVPREEIIEMLERSAREVGLGLREFYELGRADELDDPRLRDLWIIWGDVIKEKDLPDTP